MAAVGLPVARAGEAAVERGTQSTWAKSGRAGGWIREAVDRLSKDREAQRRMAREVVVRHAAYGLQERFRTVFEGQGHGTDPILGGTGGVMERVLGELGVSAWLELFENDPESFPPTATRSAFALSAALPIAMSEACAEGYASANA